MNELNGMLARLAADERLRPSHVSLYVAIMWPGGRLDDVSLQAYAKISPATFYRCLRDLRAWGYLTKNK